LKTSALANQIRVTLTNPKYLKSQKGIFFTFKRSHLKMSKLSKDNLDKKLLCDMGM